MYNDTNPVFLIDRISLEEKLRTIIREELQILSQKINREPKILTREQAAEKLGVCPNTISDYVKRGQLKNRGIGRKILILESELDGVKPNPYTHYKKAP
jgi:hypothetical protein